jgi:cytochrome c-type biogenesis protein CcmH/NrfG
MKKENVIILVIIVFIIGFIAGGISGIKFSAKNTGVVRQVGSVEGGTAQRGAEDDPHGANAADFGRLEAAVKNDPKNLTALIDLGNAYFDGNRYEQAIDAYKKALALDPKNADVHTDLGIMYRAVKNSDEAIKEFKEAAKINPTHKNSRFNLGIVLQMDKKDISGAASAWEDFLRVDPEGKQADMARAMLSQLKELSK